jgi:hypothetical protein
MFATKVTDISETGSYLHIFLTSSCFKEYGNISLMNALSVIFSLCYHGTKCTTNVPGQTQCLLYTSKLQLQKYHKSWDHSDMNTKLILHAKQRIEYRKCTHSRYATYMSNEEMVRYEYFTSSQRLHDL